MITNINISDFLSHSLGRLDGAMPFADALFPNLYNELGGLCTTQMRPLFDRSLVKELILGTFGYPLSVVNS